ncbi:hypothetical protein ACFYUR_12425 [Micromonospora haikouensis]|uniref:hypothetical protein n=1 Tax=Micromonospora haikouensis TaxID=686309 RepID=UPI0036AEB892
MSHQAELLRMAAEKMVKRANAATPGPWFATELSARYGGIVAAGSDTYPAHDGYGGHLIGESMSPENREHVSSWAPSAALAVADWLEDTSYRIDDTPYPVDDDWIERNYRAPLAVARAYLGVSQ